MAKAIKLKNNTYWDSTTVVHNKKNLNNVIDNLINYTTGEQVVGKYLGKTLYKKTIYQTLPVGDGANVFSIPNAIIHKYEGLVESNYGYWWSIPNPYYEEEGYKNYVQFNSSRNKITINCNAFYNTSCTIDLTLYYTKTTD